MRNSLNAKVVFFKGYYDDLISIPKNTTINGYLDGFIFNLLSNNIMYTIPFINEYASIEIIN